jgi:hypothetical protein
VGSEDIQPGNIRLWKQGIKHQPALVSLFRSRQTYPRKRVERLQKFVTNEAVKIAIKVKAAPGLGEPLHNLVHKAPPLTVNDGKAIQRFAGCQNQASP